MKVNQRNVSTSDVNKDYEKRVGELICAANIAEQEKIKVFKNKLLSKILSLFEIIIPLFFVQIFFILLFELIIGY